MSSNKNLKLKKDPGNKEQSKPGKQSIRIYLTVLTPWCRDCLELSRPKFQSTCWKNCGNLLLLTRCVNWSRSNWNLVSGDSVGTQYHCSRGSLVACGKRQLASLAATAETRHCHHFQQQWQQFRKSVLHCALIKVTPTWSTDWVHCGRPWCIPVALKVFVNA